MSETEQPVQKLHELGLVEQLDALETWLLDTDTDMKMPAGMIRPARAATEVVRLLSRVRELEEALKFKQSFAGGGE